MTDRQDVVIVGGGHNGLVAATYLARAGLSVLLLEKNDTLGGATNSSRPFDGVDVRLSRYSYLVSLLPKLIIDELGLPIRLRHRRVHSYTPVDRDGTPTGLLVDDGDPVGTTNSFRRVSGSDTEFQRWQDFYRMTAEVARTVFPTMTEPLPSRDEMRALVGPDAWRTLFEEPISVVLEKTFTDDTIRGVALTDALIGEFVRADEPDLRQNRVFLYHVIGNGTGDWDVPVGGMGAVRDALVDSATKAGARLVTNAEVHSIDPDGVVNYKDDKTVAARYVLANVAPAVLTRLLGERPSEPDPEGAQLKVNMVLRRLPRLRDPLADPTLAFAGTLHVHEGYAELAAAHAEADAGTVPSRPPCEIYCHSLTDPSIIGPAERAAGAHTLTLFGLHMPARLFRDGDNETVKDRALRATIATLDSVLAEPIEDCLWTDEHGDPCIEAKSPLDIEAEIGMPGGHIFHRDLSWPYAETADEVGTWGVETAHERVFVCGAGARRGGAVSGIPGRNAAMAVLAATRRAPH